MRELLRGIGICAVLVGSFWLGTVAGDRSLLGAAVIPIQITGAANSPADQEQLMQVWDAMHRELDRELRTVSDVRAAKERISRLIPALQCMTEGLLNGTESAAMVTWTSEALPARIGERLCIPSGVYETLSITLGSGQGEKRSGVVFPRTGAARTLGFTQELTDALAGKRCEQIRFFLLDNLGKLENLLVR